MFRAGHTDGTVRVTGPAAMEAGVEIGPLIGNLAGYRFLEGGEEGESGPWPLPAVM